MDSDFIERRAFAAIHDLKKDMALLSGCVDRLGEPETEKSVLAVTGEKVPDRMESVYEFVSLFNAFIDKYEESVNDKIRIFIAEIKNIVISRNAELVMAPEAKALSAVVIHSAFAVKLDVAEDGRLSVSNVKYKIKNTDGVYDDKETVLTALSEALFNASVHMERFIPVKYLSYDAGKDYRILKQEGNIYTKEV